MAESPTPLGTRIKQVLMEARVVLPGAQALLGFQFGRDAHRRVRRAAESPRSTCTWSASG